MGEDVSVKVSESERLGVQVLESEPVVLRVGEQSSNVNVELVESERIVVCLSKPEAINVRIVGSLLGHGLTSPVTDHGDVESSGERKNDVLLFNSGKKKYENKQILSFDESTDEVIIGLN